MLITSTVDICIQYLGRVEEMVFAARRSYASTVLGVVILSVCLSVRLSHACFVTNPKNLPAIFLYHILITASAGFSLSRALFGKMWGPSLYE